MSLFKIKLTPIAKVSGWDRKKVTSSRKEKTCEICQRHLPVGSPGYTFSQKRSEGFQKQFLTKYTCINTKCVDALVTKLNSD